MKIIDKIYINGQFVTPHGMEVSDLINPSVNQVIGHVTPWRGNCCGLHYSN